MNDLIVLLQAAPEAFRASGVLRAARQSVNGSHKQQDPSPYAAHSVLKPRTQPFKGVLARTYTFSTCGATTNNSLARAVNAFAISPVTWALRPSSFANVSKMPNFPGPILIAYHFKVAFSFSVSGWWSANRKLSPLPSGARHWVMPNRWFWHAPKKWGTT